MAESPRFPRKLLRSSVAPASSRLRTGLSLALLTLSLGTVSLNSAAQVRLTQMSTSQAAGNVVFCIAKDAIIVASASAKEVAGSRPPAILPFGQGRLAVVLGAADWTRDTDKPVQLDAELPGLVQRILNTNVKANPQEQSATDIEAIGVTVLEFIRPLVSDIHQKLNLASDEPLIELLLADYEPNYGPEIWSLRYRVQQKNLGNEYWQTSPLRPAYVQLYPPEKGQPRTFVEARYPAKLSPMDLKRAAQSDPGLQRIRSSSAEIEKAVAAVVNGESDKALAHPLEDFMRAALPVLAGPQAKLALGAIDDRYRFQWVLEPEDARPLTTEAPPTTQPGQREQQTDRPSLRRAGPPTTQ